MATSTTLPFRLSRNSFLLLCALGLLIAGLFAAMPVSVRFADDPLLRLRRLDPQLTTPGAAAECGSAVRNLSVEPDSTDLYDVAEAGACQRAARRRVSSGVAAAAICVTLGLLGLYGSSPDRRR